jgi:hypothetical protein
MPTLTLKTNGNLLFCTPAGTEHSAGERELFLSTTHDDPMLPEQGEAINWHILPVLLAALAKR